MARYYRYGRRYRRSGGRYWRRNWWRRGVSRAQGQGTRRFSISIPIDGYGSVGVSSGQVYSVSCGFQPFYNSNVTAAYPAEYQNRLGNLINSNLFTTYCGLYDEVKLNSVSLSVAVTSVPENKSAIKVYTCVDRHCNLNDIRHFYNVANMAGSAESSSVMFTSLDRSKVRRYFIARDRQERDTFFDSSLGTVAYSPAQGTTWNMAGPLEFIETGSLYGAFNPIIYLGFQVGSAPAADGTVAFQYRVVWNLTFRNPKYGVTGSSGRSGGLDVSSGVDDGDVKRDDSELDEETIKKLKDLLHEDVQLPLTEDSKKDEMDDDEKGS